MESSVLQKSPSKTTQTGSFKYPAKTALKIQRLGKIPQEYEKEGRVKDERAVFERLISPIQHRMKHSIWRVVRNGEAAEDTLQDALTIIWRKRERILEHPKPDALILKICLNASYDHLRKSKHHLKNQSLEAISHVSSDLTDEAPDNLERQNMETEVLSAIGRLPRSQALSVLMRVIQGQSYSEISETLGCSETTARIHVSRARAKLSRWLKHFLPPRLSEGEE